MVGHSLLQVFTNAQDWQNWQYFQLRIPIYLQLPSLPDDIGKYEIRCLWEY